MISNKLYDVLKWVNLIFFPAMAILVGRVRSRGNNYCGYVGTLTIIEQ